MNWEKSVFSNILWGIYTLVTVFALVTWSITTVLSLGGTSFLGLTLALGLAVVAEVGVFLFRLIPVGREYVERPGFNKLLLGEIALVLLFLVLGFIYRINGIAGVTEGGVYYEAAFVAEGQSISKMAHGAEYVYLRLLHTVFLLAGNKLVAGIWFQVMLQMLAILLLYFGVRKLAGALPALMMLLFFMYTGPVVQEALSLSPKPLFLLLFAIGLVLLAACRGNVRRWSLFLMSGLWIGLTGYLDATAFLLLLFGVAAALETKGRKVSAKSRAIAVGGCLAGMTAGFFGLILLDAHFGGKTFTQVLGTWGSLYLHGDHGFSTDSLNGILNWQGVLILLLRIGVVSYWLCRKRDYFSIWILVSGLAVGSQYFGVLTKTLPPFPYILLFLTVLAGVGLRESILKRAVVSKIEEQPAEEVEEIVELVRQEPERESVESGLEIIELIKTKQEEPGRESELIGSDQENSEYEQLESESGSGEPETDSERNEPDSEQTESEQSEPKTPKLRFFETPLPMPKPHQKKVLDYNVVSTNGDDDFDYSVGDSDDFDIDFDIE